MFALLSGLLRGNVPDQYVGFQIVKPELAASLVQVDAVLLGNIGGKAAVLLGKGTVQINVIAPVGLGHLSQLQVHRADAAVGQGDTLRGDLLRYRGQTLNIDGGIGELLPEFLKQEGVEGDEAGVAAGGQGVGSQQQEDLVRVVAADVVKHRHLAAVGGLHRPQIAWG